MPAAQLISPSPTLTSDGTLAYLNYPNRLWMGMDGSQAANQDGADTGGVNFSGAEPGAGAQNSTSFYSETNLTSVPPVTNISSENDRPIWIGAEIRAYAAVDQTDPASGPYTILKADWNNPSDYVLVTQKAISYMPLRVIDSVSPGSVARNYIEFAGWDTVNDGDIDASYKIEFPAPTTAPSDGEVLKVKGSPTGSGTTSDPYIIGLEWGVGGTAGGMTSFTLAGDTGTQTITEGNTVTVSGGIGLVSSAGATDKVTVDLDFNGLTQITPVDEDFFAFYDASGTTHGKVTGANLKTYVLGGSTINASTVNTASDDGTTTRYLVFSTPAQNSASLYVDSGTSPLTYNPNSSTLTASSMVLRTSLITSLISNNSTLEINASGGSGTVIRGSQSGINNTTRPTLTVMPSQLSGANTQFVKIEGGDLYLATKTIADPGPTTPVNIIFEGATSQGTRTTLTVVDPTAARTVTIPDASGTVVLKDGSNNIGVGIINDLVVGGNLTVSGTTTTINTETVNIEDNIIVLNSNVTSTPSTDAGIEVERGTSNNVSLLWDETATKWSATRINSDVSTYPNTLYPMVIADSSSTLHETGTEGAAAAGTVSFTGTITGVALTASSVSGKLTPGMYIFGSGITTGTFILSGPADGGNGEYVVNNFHQLTGVSLTAESGRLGEQFIHTASIKYLDVKNLNMSGTWTLNATINNSLDLKNGGLKLPYLTGTYHTSNAMSGLAEGQIAYDTATDRVVYNRGDSATSGQDESGNTLAVVVDESATQTLTNKTLTAPKIVSGGFIADANGNEQIKFTTTSSAVNEITITNAATGSSPLIASSGNDTNIDLKLQGKGTGTVVIDDSAIKTSNSTFGVFDVTATQVDAFGAATTLTLGHDGTSASTTNIVTGGITTGTKVINIGTGAAAGNSTTTINVGGGSGTTNTTCSVLLGCPNAATSVVEISGNNLLFKNTGSRITLSSAAIIGANATHTLPNITSGNLVVASTNNFNASGYLLTGAGSTSPSVYTDPENIVVGGVFFRNETTGTGTTRFPIPFLANQLSTDNPSTFGSLTENTKTTGYLKSHWSTTEDEGLYYAPGDIAVAGQPSVNGGTLYAGFFAGYLDCGTY
jgi:hypothetical protein